MKKLCILKSGYVWHGAEFRKICSSLEGSYELTCYPHKADLIIQYFCAATMNEIKKVAQDLAFFKKVKPTKAKLIVCGCAVEVLGKEAFEKIDFVDLVIGRSNIADNVLKFLNQQQRTELYFKKGENFACIKVLDGCRKKNGWCTFCKQNYMKIPVNSMPMDEVIAQARNFSETKGIYTICLGGLNLCNYGIDMPDKTQKLHTLIRKVSELPLVEKIELYGLTVADIYDELTSEIATNPKIVFIELGIQSGSEEMLKIMNTGATIKDIQKYLDMFAHKAEV